MKLVLVNPPFDLFKEGYGSKVSIKKGHLPPLGIGYIASAARKGGHEVSIVDSPVLGYGMSEAKDAVMALRPDVIGIYSMTCTISRAGELSGLLRKAANTPIVLGGPHATCFPQEALKEYEAIDYVAVGEGEGIINELLAAIRDDREPSHIRGVAFRKKRPDGSREIVDNGKAHAAVSLDEIERPARDLYPNHLYQPLPYAYRQLPASTVITTRGCPYSKCKFCFGAGKMKERIRRHSITRVLDEVEELCKKYNVREVVFLDDVFLFNEAWIIPFCEKLKEKKLGITWSCAARVDMVTKKILKAAREAGCWGVFYGLESGVQELLDIIDKGTTVEQAKKAIAWTHEAGLESRGSFMVALPGETPELFRKTIEFAIDIDLTFAQFTATFPDPGTELYDIALKRGKIGPYKGMNKATYIPDGYKGPEEIEEMVKTAYRSFYLRPGYVLKSLSYIRNISDVKRYIEGFLFLSGLT